MSIVDRLNLPYPKSAKPDDEIVLQAWCIELMSEAAEALQALLTAVKPFDACVFNDNGDVTIDTGALSTQHWLKLASVIRGIDNETVG